MLYIIITIINTLSIENIYINFYPHDGCFTCHVAHLIAEWKEVGKMRGGHFGLNIGRKLFNIIRGGDIRAFQKSKVQNVS